ncbi:hypothetical protein GQ55_2G173900 [Panicum hallii var. hallii]|uniref:Uncharacterized protein n=1 Tax=Panicum hallii var. hallii TaxID=1504633 RepID=A0A2T7EQ65_9POAL|nr:hypothetical protein GQ55_2G173900 [Panicum hallii var. hallii]
MDDESSCPRRAYKKLLFNAHGGFQFLATHRLRRNPPGDAAISLPAPPRRPVDVRAGPLFSPSCRPGETLRRRRDPPRPVPTRRAADLLPPPAAQIRVSHRRAASSQRRSSEVRYPPPAGSGETLCPRRPSCRRSSRRSAGLRNSLSTLGRRRLKVLRLLFAAAASV